MKFVNLTGKEIVVKSMDGSFRTFPFSLKNKILMGTVSQIGIREIDAIEIIQAKFGVKEELIPAPIEGTMYIVNPDIAKLIPDRFDIIAPGPTMTTSDSHGKSNYYKGFVCYAQNK